MKRSVTIIILLSVLAFPQFTRANEEPSIETIAAALAAKTTALNSEYLLFRVGEPTRESALVVYLHGAGGRKADIRSLRGQVSRGLIPGLRAHAGEPVFVVAPQALPKKIWQPTDLDRFLEHLDATHDFDRDRVYVTGNSMGGYGTWVWGASSPQSFAALAPIVGGLGEGGPKDITPDLDQWAKAVSALPVWAFHGAEDRVVPADRTERMIAAIRAQGGTLAKSTIYPNEGHGAGAKVYSDPAFYAWLFAQRREG